MSTEHRLTDRDALTIVTGELVKDMHHVLGRIAAACVIAWFLFTLVGLLDLLAGDWPGAIGSLGTAAYAFWLEARPST